jgi:cytochrome c biogenesis protein CcdA
VDRSKFLMTLLVVAGALLVGVVGGLLYALAHASESALRWWAGLATVALPLALAGGYRVGKLAAGERLRGLEQGVDTVMDAAQRTADLRGQAVREARQGATAAVDPAQIVIVPARPPALPGGGNVVEM